MHAFIIHLVLALVVGWAAQRLLGYREIDFLTTLGLGFVGSWLGTGFARWLHLPYAYPGDTLQTWANISFPWSVAGCVVLIAGVNFIFRSSDRTND